MVSWTWICVSAAGMKGWVGRLVFVLRGDCGLGCVIRDTCGVFWCCVCGCMLFGLGNGGIAGSGGTTGCGGVCWDGVLVMLAEAIGVCCPQGSELSGDVSALCCLFVLCVLAASCGVVDVIG